MNPFFIFVIVLTTAYVIYFAVNIAHDLYGKKEEKKNTTEEYDVSDMADNGDKDEDAEEDSIAVVESENGFSIGEQEVETTIDVVSDMAEDDGVAANAANGNDTDGETKESYVERVKAAVSEKMEEPDVYLSNPMYDAELTTRLLANGLSGNNNAPKVPYTRTNCREERMQTSRNFLLALGIAIPTSLSAKCGGVDYSWGADALATMHDYVVTMMLYIVWLAYAFAAIIAIISALQIYIKMNTGEEGVTKSIMTLVSACLFIIGATIVFPAFFGYRI